LPGSGAKRTDIAFHEAQRMARLLEDMLLYAKPLELDLQPLDLGHFVAAFLRSAQRLERKPGQQFRFIGTASGPRILADQDRLTQILLNLARNAAEAAPEASTIDWSVSEQISAGTVCLEVHNSGEPIPPELLPRITDPFVTTRSSGTGLGLSIVKRLANAHGAELQIHSQPVEGTRVRITFPSAAR